MVPHRLKKGTSANQEVRPRREVDCEIPYWLVDCEILRWLRRRTKHLISARDSLGRGHLGVNFKELKGTL